MEDVVRTVARDFPETELLVFPELFLTGDDPFTAQDPVGFLDQVAEPVPGPFTEKVGGIAASAARWLVAGSVFERAGDRTYNTALAFAPDGALVARHRKVFPWRPWERVTAGEGPTVFDIPGVARLGLAVCYEAWFPETARGLALAGAEVIVQPALTATSDRNEEVLMARAAAIANQVFVLNVNAASTIGGGRSVGIDPEGRVLFEGGGGPELIVEVLDVDRVPLVRERGTRGLNRVWQHFLQAPAGVFEPYRRFLRD
jgi:formamidase